MAELTTAETHFVEALAAAGLKVKASYTPGEVCQILCISERQFRYLTAEYSEINGNPASPQKLDSFTLGTQKRVRFQELVAWLDRNRTCEREAAPGKR